MSSRKLIRAIDEWLREELDHVESWIGRECRGRDMPPLWHRARRLRDELDREDEK